MYSIKRSGKKKVDGHIRISETNNNPLHTPFPPPPPTPPLKKEEEKKKERKKKRRRKNPYEKSEILMDKNDTYTTIN